MEMQSKSKAFFALFTTMKPKPVVFRVGLQGGNATADNPGQAKLGGTAVQVDFHSFQLYFKKKNRGCSLKMLHSFLQPFPSTRSVLGNS